MVSFFNSYKDEDVTRRIYFAVFYCENVLVLSFCIICLYVTVESTETDRKRGEREKGATWVTLWL